MTDIPFTPLVALGAIIFALINFLKYVTNKSWSQVVTQAVAWGAGVIGVALFAHSQIGGGIAIGGTTLHRLDWASQFIVGLSATSFFSPVIKTLEAIDNTNTAVTPALIPSLARNAVPKATHRATPTATHIE